MASPVKVLDAWAVVAWLKDQAPASHAVEALLTQAKAGRVRLLLNIVNLGEIFYITARADGTPRAEYVLEEVKHLPLEICSAPNSLVLDAARLKSRHAISYADAFAVATALRQGFPIVTGDPELKKLAGGGTVTVEWIGSASSAPE